MKWTCTIAAAAMALAFAPTIAQAQSVGAVENAAGFETLRSINLIIGRNNSGKLALLDLVELACNNLGVDVALFHKNKTARILVGKPLAEDELRGEFPAQTSGGSFQATGGSMGRSLSAFV